MILRLSSILALVFIDFFKQFQILSKYNYQQIFFLYSRSTSTLTHRMRNYLIEATTTKMQFFVLKCVNINQKGVFPFFWQFLKHDRGFCMRKNLIKELSFKNKCFLFHPPIKCHNIHFHNLNGQLKNNMICSIHNKQHVYVAIAENL